MLDLTIKNGLLFDGLGSPPLRADVAVKDCKIAFVSPHISEPAREVVDAAGLWVTPGFIDIHTHYDIELEVAPGLSESVRHGVTTVVMGNCSLSLAIGTPRMLADIFQRVETLSPVLIQKWLKRSVSWHTPREYLDHLRSLLIGPNVAALFGHSALRAHVLGLERSLKDRATAAELEQMRHIAGEALDAGFTGISIDMVPWHMMSGELRGRTIPSQHADYREYKMLSDVCRERDAVFQVTPNPQRLMSVVDILRMSLGLRGRRLRITSLAALDSVADRRMWRTFPPLLFIFNRLLGCNIRFQTLTEPFTVYSDGPVTPLFEEFASGVRLNDCSTRDERRRLWKAREFREAFQREWTSRRRNSFHRRLELMEIVRCPDQTLVGKTFTQAAELLGREPVELFIDLLESYDTDLRWVSCGANDRLSQRLSLMSHEHILPGFTDAGAHVQNLGYYDGALSLLRQAVTNGFMPIERAVSRVTGEPSKWFRLDAGVIKEGARADIVIIRPESLREPISAQVEFADPLLDGAMRMVKRDSDRVVEAVYIGGRSVIIRGEIMSALGREKLGEVLHPTGTKEDSKRPLRNRINDSITDHPFTDYWDIFLLKHRDPINIALHFLGVIIFYGVIALAVAAGNPWLLFMLPLSQLVGLAGHYFFERSHIDLQDAVFSFRASRCLNKMFLYVLTGKYRQEVERAANTLNEYLTAKSKTEAIQKNEASGY
jgi:N-acyl-D-aspartate/D-glutamate deacylase